jgi:hypothetical protein
METPKTKFVFPKYLYARTTNNKTIDVSYAPQDMNAVEYVQSDLVELTWEDICDIDGIIHDVQFTHKDEVITSEAFYKEVLRRFNEEKNK